MREPPKVLWHAAQNFPAKSRSCINVVQRHYVRNERDRSLNRTIITSVII